MGIIESLLYCVILGTAGVWLLFAILLIAGSVFRISNMALGCLPFFVAVAALAISVYMLFQHDPHTSVWWWLLAVVSGSVPFYSVCRIGSWVKKYRCPWCNSWGVYCSNLKEASYAGMKTSSRRRAAGRTVVNHAKGLKAVKVYKSVNLCHCKKCGTFYEWWEEGGDYDSVEISEARYMNSTQRTFRPGVDHGVACRTKNSRAESFIYMHEDPDAGDE